MEPGEKIDVGIDITAFVMALKEIANSDITSEAIKMLLSSIYIKPQGLNETGISTGRVEKTDETKEKNVHMLRMLSEFARSEQEFAVIKVLLASYDVQHTANALKRKSEEQIDRRQPQDRKKQRKRSNAMKAKDNTQPSTSQPNILPRYQCYLCDNTLSGVSGIQTHYKRKHEIIDINEILFYNGAALFTMPSSNVNTQEGTAPWFIREKMNALEKYTAGTCRLCEKELGDLDTLSKHYEIYHKVVDLTKVEQLFKFRTGAHLDGLPTSDPRKSRQPRQSPRKINGNGNKRRTSARSTSTVHTLILSSSEDSDNDSDGANHNHVSKNDDANYDAVDDQAIIRIPNDMIDNDFARLRSMIMTHKAQTRNAVENGENHEEVMNLLNDIYNGTFRNVMPRVTSVKTERIVDSEETIGQETEVDTN